MKLFLLIVGISLARDRSRSKRKGRRHQKLDENWHVSLMGEFSKRSLTLGPFFSKRTWKTRLESINDKDVIYEGYRSNSTSLTIEDIYEKLDLLTRKFEIVNTRLANMDNVINGLEQKVEDLWVSLY